MSQRRVDESFMAQALALATEAGSYGEVPVGALVVVGDSVLGRGMNRCQADHDPSAHAEIVALKECGRTLQSPRLDGATLYVTLEPCLMCCGALLQARVARLVFGAREPRTGGVVSIHESLRLPRVDHHVAV
ncbi:MAG: nucleoside deaminase, partial [Granulosicoccus sp.]|nr:nucleoside deaminase [Granulosicoccus sp.]